MSDFDAVVVGAGCAGLSAALRMASAGKKTLLIEQHNTPGGCATSFLRGGYEFDVSVHEICDVGPEDFPGEVRELFSEYGVEQDWIGLSDCFRFVSTYSDGTPLDVTMPHGIGAFIEKMEYYVPGSAPKMRLLFEILEEMYLGSKEVSDPCAKINSLHMMKHYPNMLRLGSYSTEKVFEVLGLPQRCRDILSVYWSYLGVPLNRLSFFHYGSMVYRYVRMGAYVPRHTAHGINMAMLGRFYELGGEVWFNCRAEEFLFTGDVCTGVRVKTGDVIRDIRCRACLANINPDIIYGRMMPKELVPEREKRLSGARDRNFRAHMVTGYFLLDGSAEELGIRDYVTFLQKYADSEKENEAIGKGIDQDEFCIFLCPSIADAALCPEGTCVCSVTTMGAKEEWEALSQQDYFRFKDRVIEKMLCLAEEKLGVKLRGHILEMATASPWTFAGFTGAPEGAAYGYEAGGWDSIAARVMMMNKDYPVGGLWPVGASGPRGDGYSGGYATGSMIAKLALKEFDARIKGGTGE